jgi:hypothetical protein
MARVPFSDANEGWPAWQMQLDSLLLQRFSRLERVTDRTRTVSLGTV